MSTAEVTQLIDRAQGGDTAASEALLPLVYDELRRLAATELAREASGHTLAPTALVHEAYLRLVGSDIKWQGRRPFFCAAATAIRRILVDHARARDALKRGGDRDRADFAAVAAATPAPAAASETSLAQVLPLHEALTKLEQVNTRQAEVVLLRYFGGLSVQETAMALSVSEATVKNDWAYARAWLRRELDNHAPAIVTLHGGAAGVMEKRAPIIPGSGPLPRPS